MPVRRFVAAYGWRAYALPILAVVTIAALIDAGRGADSTTAASEAGAAPASETSVAPPTARGSYSLKIDRAGADDRQRAIKAAELPAGEPYTAQGAGTFRILPGTSKVIGHGPVQRYAISVENGITGVDLAAFANKIDSTLADRRSWVAAGDIALHRVDTAPFEWQVTLVSALTIRRLCGYEIPVETSCWDSTNRRVMINVSRWVRGAASYIGDLDLYRTYAINHEVGHALGHQHAHQCLPGGLAPVMMQQTLGLKSVTGQMCQANAWPYPPGVAGTPGREAPDTPKNSEFGLNAGE